MFGWANGFGFWRCLIFNGLKKMAAILFGFWIVQFWNGWYHSYIVVPDHSKNQNIQNLNIKTFCIWMVFGSRGSDFEPPLYWVIFLGIKILVQWLNYNSALWIWQVSELKDSRAKFIIKLYYIFIYGKWQCTAGMWIPDLSGIWMLRMRLNFIVEDCFTLNCTLRSLYNFPK